MFSSSTLFNSKGRRRSKSAQNWKCTINIKHHSHPNCTESTHAHPHVISNTPSLKLIWWIYTLCFKERRGLRQTLSCQSSIISASMCFYLLLYKGISVSEQSINKQGKVFKSQPCSHRCAQMCLCSVELKLNIVNISSQNDSSVNKLRSWALVFLLTGSKQATG